MTVSCTYTPPAPHDAGLTLPRLAGVKIKVNKPITVTLFRDLLNHCSLGARRPLADEACLQAMLQNAPLLVTAWHKTALIGVARSVTDFAYCCYLSDLAVHEDYQRRGLGRALIETTFLELGPRCKIVLRAAPQAQEYYAHLGLTAVDNAWLLDHAL